MSYEYEALIMGIVLSADSFSAAVAMGSRPFIKKDLFIYTLAATLAAALSICLGSYAGTHIIDYISSYDHWVAFLLVAAVAMHMGYEGIMGMIHPQAINPKKESFHRFSKVLIIAFATSLDALGVGMSLGISSKPLWPYLLGVSFFAIVASVLGMILARKLSKRFGPTITLCGALILAALSLELLKI